jgi:hypothetical protein
MTVRYAVRQDLYQVKFENDKETVKFWMLYQPLTTMTVTLVKKSCNVGGALACSPVSRDNPSLDGPSGTTPPPLPIWAFSGLPTAHSP